MEYFEILNENGFKTGKIDSRTNVHKLGLHHAAVCILVINESNQILLQKRSSNKDSNPDKWDISCAGHVDLEETFEDAAIRELNEELGIKINKTDLIELSTVHIHYRSIFHQSTFIENEFDKIFVCHVSDNIPLSLQKDEVQETKWISHDSLKLFLSTNDHCIYHTILDVIYDYIDRTN